MSLTDFEHGYWYALELKEFAESIGVSSAGKLRKDELEKVIREFLKTGRIVDATKRSLSKKGVRDVDLGLTLELRVANYTSNRVTKDFIEREARRIAPDLKRRSGARYWLNRWREEQLTQGRSITYGDLIAEHIRLNSSVEPFPRIEHGRYINFVADFLKNEKDATHAAAVKAWMILKSIDSPKNYASWIQQKSKHQQK